MGSNVECITGKDYKDDSDFYGTYKKVERTY